MRFLRRDLLHHILPMSCSVANYTNYIAKKLATLESSKYGSGSDADVIPDCDARDCPNNHCL